MPLFAIVGKWVLLVAIVGEWVPLLVSGCHWWQVGSISGEWVPLLVSGCQWVPWADSLQGGVHATPIIVQSWKLLSAANKYHAAIIGILKVPIVEELHTLFSVAVYKPLAQWVDSWDYACASVSTSHRIQKWLKEQVWGYWYFT